jgi:hypothetical protein
MRSFYKFHVALLLCIDIGVWPLLLSTGNWNQQNKNYDARERIQMPLSFIVGYQQYRP